jgi:hypothetical protein
MSDYRNSYREAQREYFWTLPRASLALVVTLIVLCGVGFGLNYLGFAQFAFFNPKYEQVRRNTFEQSQAYVESQRRDIQNLRLDWIDATPEKKAAIRSVALQRINGLPPEVAAMPEVVSFRNELMGETK